MSFFKPTIYLLSLAFLFACSQPQNYRDEIYEKPEIDPDPPAPSLSPEESMKTMYLPHGYKLELVASEPMVEEPIAIAWDGDGKMYVAELLTYMQDIDGTDEDEPWSRVSVLEDLDGDGKMDKATVFVDSLRLPRNLLPLDDQVIISETYTNHFYSYRDTDGDRVADEKIQVFHDTTMFRGNLEHQSANLTWNIDNYMYLSSQGFRYRWEDGKMKRDTMLDNSSGQYGLTYDETGKLFYSSAGGEVIAQGFQQPTHYGPMRIEGQWEEGFEQPWPIIGTPDVQGGPKRIREDNTLNKFTGVSGQEIFLGDRLPAYGDLFVPEPVGRVVRRAKVNKIEGKTVLSNAYKEAEFMASTDPNFRPVMAQTGPDGALYIVDMYRGIIQEGNWVREGSYLRPEVKRRKLDENIGKGRIYRIVHEQIEPYEPIKLLSKSAEELVEFLGHPNGWYRVQAQKLLVVRNETSIIPTLKKITRDNEGLFSSLFSKKDAALERFHALWTLEGLGALEKDLLLEKLGDKDPRVQMAAMRLLEPDLLKGDESVFKAIVNLSQTENIDIMIQAILSLKSYAQKEEAIAAIEEIKKRYPENDMIAASSVVLTDELEELKRKYIARNSWTKSMIIEGYQHYKELCSTCHGKDAEGLKDLGPSLVKSPRMMHKDIGIPIRILLDGLSGPVDGVDYGIMAPLKTYDDQWIAEVLTYVRENFGDEGGTWAGKVRQIREEHKDRNAYWTIPELMRSAGD